MMSDKQVEGCVKPAPGPLASKSATPSQPQEAREEKKSMVFVGREAPDFEAAAFVGGGFKNIKLSSFRGKWVFLCFYPGDFTFV
jgi:peroxiredoxin (alkyl hydroperoxide reductase subunit C)